MLCVLLLSLRLPSMKMASLSCSPWRSQLSSLPYCTRFMGIAVTLWSLQMSPEALSQDCTSQRLPPWPIMECSTVMPASWACQAHSPYKRGCDGQWAGAQDVDGISVWGMPRILFLSARVALPTQNFKELHTDPLIFSQKLILHKYVYWL